MDRTVKEHIKEFSKILPAELYQRGISAYHSLRLRWLAFSSGRSLVRGYRIVFPCSEVADYERFRTLSAGPGEAVVKLDYSVASPGTERAYLLSLPGAIRPFPVHPGYSGAGVVMSVGKGVSSLHVGERVAGRVGHATIATVSCDFLFRVPNGVASESAAFIELGIIVLQGIRKARILPGESVLIVGQGIIGNLADRIARTFGAAPVVATARSHTKVLQDNLVSYADRFLSIEELISDSSMGSFDVVLEATGDPSCLSFICDCARPGGRIVLLGSSRGITFLNFSRDIAMRGLTIVGAHITGMPSVERSKHYWTYRDEGQLFLRWLNDGRISVNDLIRNKINPVQANEFYHHLAIRDSTIVTGCFDWRKFEPAPPLTMDMLDQLCLYEQKKVNSLDRIEEEL